MSPLHKRRVPRLFSWYSSFDITCLSMLYAPLYVLCQYIRIAVCYYFSYSCGCIYIMGILIAYLIDPIESFFQYSAFDFQFLFCHIATFPTPTEPISFSPGQFWGLVYKPKVTRCHLYKNITSKSFLILSFLWHNPLNIN